MAQILRAKWIVHLNRGRYFPVLRVPLLYMAKSDLLRRVAGRSKLAWRFASRFVAGESITDALKVSRSLNGSGASSEIDYLGENTRDDRDAYAARQVYLDVLDRIASESVDAHVSLKLTQMGLDVDWSLCLENVREVVERAAELGNFVWIDMESSKYTDLTLRAYSELRSGRPNVGVAIQAALRRSKGDVSALLEMGGAVRLCKGAYLEPDSVAFQNRRDVDRSFALLSEMLLASGRVQALATHDERMIKYAARFAESHGILAGAFEFQMLYGVRRDLQSRLLRDGHAVRVYVPFGEKWYPYLMRRLAERPANLMFFLSSLAKEAGARR